MAGNQSSILNLPVELHVQIFNYLDPVRSMCLALISKKLYKVHCAHYSTIPLDAFTYDCPTSPSALCHLYTHLQTWKPSHFKYCGGCHEFCFTNNHPMDHARGRCDECLRTEEMKTRDRDWKRLRASHITESRSGIAWENS